METESQNNETQAAQTVQAASPVLQNDPKVHSVVHHHHLPIAGLAVLLVFLSGLVIGYYVPKNRNAGNAYQLRDTATTTNTNTTVATPTPTAQPTAAGTTVTPTAATTTPTPSSAAKPTQANTKTYTNSRYKFSFAYPSSWTVKEELEESCNRSVDATPPNICQFVTFQKSANEKFVVEVTDNNDKGTIGYVDYQQSYPKVIQTKNLTFAGSTVVRKSLGTSTKTQFISVFPPQHKAESQDIDVIPVQNLSIYMYGGSLTSDPASSAPELSADFVTGVDQIIQSFKKL